MLQDCADRLNSEELSAENSIGYYGNWSWEGSWGFTVLVHDAAK